ncbi:PCNA-associated factor-like [Dendronephthya gigantea]|uniref:PCNA-associated factor-like n=1 Tax=Dendronephthya gigantea TaxID=151771 RepID=UPI00106D9104|nr:PCNA-associated factor-like [Dendronephthya gigantea]
MVRTRGDNSARRAVGAKAPRKQAACSSSSSSSIMASPGSKDKYSGGNPVRWMPTPSWQKGIGGFLQKCNSVNSPCDSKTNEPEDGTTPSSLNSTSDQEQISEITSLD